MSPGINARERAKRILLVEDNATLRELTQAVLSSSGYEVLVAENGFQALALFKSEGPVDLVITDLIMPGMNGVDLADRLNECEPVKVLLISGNPDEVISVQGLVERRTDFLSKPFSATTLLERVRAVLSGSEGPRLMIKWT
jgi:DNA-binding response OmpR family regulator